LDRGVVHVHQGRTDVFASADGLSGDYVTSLFEDREGNLWVATHDGLDRFRDFAVPTISSQQGLSTVFAYSVLAAKDGSVWLGTSGGLNRWRDGQITVYRRSTGRSLALKRDTVAAGRGVRDVIDDGLPDSVLGSLFQDDRGRIWAATVRGLAYFEDGRFVPVSRVSRQIVRSMAEEDGGSLWIADQDQGLVHLVGESEVERIPWAGLGRRDFGSALAADRARGGYGSDL